MITVSVPTPEVADAIGEVPADVRVVVWNPAESDPPTAERDHITMACLAHRTGGRTLYGRLGTLPALAAIQIPSAGYEHAVPFVPAGVALCNARGVHDTRTAEMALLLTLASQRALPRFFDAQQRGVWDAYETAPSLADARVLIVGYGSIGAAIGARMRACEAHVEGVARSARTAPDGVVVHAVEDLPALLPRFDIVVVVTPHDDSTDKLVDARFLAAMPNDALLVNVGRGAVVDTDALLAEVTSGRLRAALDVVDPEPLPEGHPLYTAPGVILTPHVAGFAQLTDPRYVALVHAQIDALRSGAGPVNVVAVGRA
ncbi:2-hydroxyacid dehydrogenase [Demequina sp. B12]|uniref:2-hydroxyacid dehydrogenase n=1 Tax=Demequina sp. B12 TaxID=2992757 RepID=UPI00237A4DEB|nr:2-hydroxyacid dehydrogenase [Demequina sp. B12]MDE0572674.1 2-hydroxyacid dehydrogenase [Demequina sp. B12]